MSDRSQRVQELFHAALDLDQGKRSAYLAEACDGDEGLRKEVESLLVALTEAGSFLSRPAGVVPVEEAGTRIDRYKLLQQIGEGGFGTVWMAEQEQPVRRRVALKIIKLGMDTRQVVARFEAERQALAMMDHPNIAKVLDGGSTASGRPYFAMELVRGVPITDFCDQGGLDLRQRIELFQLVCDAVQHAHQKGVIHRDLKPSNILVTLREGLPVPKVIDFGIAKATNQELTQKTLFTEFRQMVGTPEYMAPEQADTSGLDVDTRADVYGLGVVLYELLAGTRPFAKPDSGEHGFHEVLRQIREVEPPKPSTVVAGARDRLPEIARRRGIEPRRLAQHLQGDLDWIVLRALEKDRSRRYPTARALAEDLDNHLNDLPVQAGPPSPGYLIAKFIRRHRRAVAAASLVLLAMVAGTIGTAVALRRALDAEKQERAAKERALTAEREERAAREQAEANLARALEAEALERTARQEAETSAAQAREQAELARTVMHWTEEILLAADPHTSRGPSYTVVQLLDDFDASLGEQLAGQPAAEAAIRTTMGGAYRNLGQLDKAEKHLRFALEWMREHGDPVSGDRATAMEQWAWLLHDRGDYAGARDAMREAYDLTVELDRDRVLAAKRLASLAEQERQLGNYVDAERMAREALAVIDTPSADPSDLGYALDMLGLCLEGQGRMQEAEPVLRRALALREQHADTKAPSLASALDNLGGVLDRQGRYEEAEELHRRALALRRSSLPEDHPDLFISMNNLASILERLDRLDDAEKLYRDALEIGRKALGPDHVQVAMAMCNLATVLMRKRELAEAEELLRAGLPLFESTLGPDHPHVATTVDILGGVLRLGGDLHGAEAAFRRALEIRQAAQVFMADEVGKAMANLALVVLEQDRMEEAERLFRESLDVRSEMPDTHPDITTTRYWLAEATGRSGRISEQVEILERVLSAERRADRGHSRNAALALEKLGIAYLAQDRPDLAEPMFRECREIYAEIYPTGLPVEVIGRLGESLWRLSRHEEAEDVLVGLYRNLAPAARKARVDTLRRIVRLYESWSENGGADKTEQANHYREVLAEVETGHER